MFFNNESTTKYNIKVNCTLEELQKKILNICYVNERSYYKLNIYMIPDEVDILNLNDLKLLESYALIQDLDGLNKKIIHKVGNTTTSSDIDDVIAIKELLKKLNYNELMYINYDIYSYSKENSNIEVKNILKQGLFIEGNDELLNLLAKLDISYDTSNLKFDNEKIALDSAKKEIENNRK